MSTLSPLMRQYFEIKQQHPDVLLLFQVGDFYELFYDDAKKAAAFLGITLTKRGFQAGTNEPIPLCGVPVHMVDHYLIKLVRGGFRVALCDQLTPATPGKVVERGVTKVLTPGTLTDSLLLPEKSVSYIASFFATQEYFGLVFAELLTGELYGTLIDSHNHMLLEAELKRFSPAEIIIWPTPTTIKHEISIKKLGYLTTNHEFVFPELENFYTSWLTAFNQKDFILKSPALSGACQVLYSYLKKNQEHALTQLTRFSLYAPDDFLLFDAATIKNLELLKNNHDESSSHTLFGVLDNAVTPMGSRLLQKWLLRPLVHQETINDRLDAVEVLIKNVAVREELVILLKQVGDVERIVGRIALRRATLRDYRALSTILENVPLLKQKITSITTIKLLGHIYSKILLPQELKSLLELSLNSDETVDWLIKEGYNPELDRLRTLIAHGAQAVAALEQREQQRTGINSLKIRYSQNQGYAIEVTKTHSETVPADYIKLQTLVNRERFTTQELKDLEYDIDRARSDSSILEKELFYQIQQAVELQVSELRLLAEALAELDALSGFATTAYMHNYTRPMFNTTHDICITDGRHPVVAARLGHEFIPNSTLLTDNKRLWIITGPNMGGKSTYLRQVALIQIMVQAGSFVSAKNANVPIVDRIFTRIGAADNVVQGKSTFLVEMEETALICNQATHKSLVILDEVGRGTSTYDGLAIAQSVVEYIYSKIKARCLFATHYHELTELAQKNVGIVAYHVASKQTNEGIILLHKIIEGVAHGSFGIEVAKTVNLPVEIVVRAQEILNHLLASKNTQNYDTEELAKRNQDLTDKVFVLQQELSYQKSFDQQKLTETLKNLDYNSLSPKQAFDILWALKEYTN